jgi:hypothetical protein
MRMLPSFSSAVAPGRKANDEAAAAPDGGCCWVSGGFAMTMLALFVVSKSSTLSIRTERAVLISLGDCTPEAEMPAVAAVLTDGML